MPSCVALVLFCIKLCQFEQKPCYTNLMLGGVRFWFVWAVTICDFSVSGICCLCIKLFYSYMSFTAAKQHSGKAKYKKVSGLHKAKVLEKSSY